MTSEQPIVEYLLGALPGIIIAIVTAGLPVWLALRKLKTNAPVDNATKLSDAALEIVEAYRTEVGDVKKELRAVKDEFRLKDEAQDKEIARERKRVTRLSRVVRDLYNGSLLLVKQVEEHGLIPDWKPPASADELLTDIVNGD